MLGGSQAQVQQNLASLNSATEVESVRRNQDKIPMGVNSSVFDSNSVIDRVDNSCYIINSAEKV